MSEETPPTFTHIDFIANELYQADARKKGYPAGVRWWCARDSLRDEYRAKAHATYERWRDGEQSNWDERDNWDYAPSAEGDCKP